MSDTPTDEVAVVGSGYTADQMGKRYIQSLLKEISLTVELRSLRAWKEKAVEELRADEWYGANQIKFCPSCRNSNTMGHTKDCRLASLLESAG